MPPSVRSAIVLLSICAITIQARDSPDEKLPRIAVIGGGIGGASAVHTIIDLFKGHMLPAPPVTVYEKETVGGRMRTVSVKGKMFEAGASVIHPRNKLMSQYAEYLGLDKLESTAGIFSLYNGKEPVFTSSQYGIMTFLKMMWRYGKSILALDSTTSVMLDDFDRIYKWQEDMQSFTTVPNLLLSMSDECMNLTQESFEDALQWSGVNQIARDEVARAGNRVNYGQEVTGTHGFVGMVSMAGMQDGLWSVRGGNDLIPKGLLKKSGATVLTEEVTTVTLKPDGTFSVATAQGGEAEYDIVIMAAPLIQGQKNVKFVGFRTDMSEHQRPYHRTVATFVKGTPNKEHFGFVSEENFPDSLFVVSDQPGVFHSVSAHETVGGSSRSDVYKLFSSAPLSEATLDGVFTSRQATDSVDWLAYPQYSTSAEFSPFVLSPRLYYVNAIEMMASAMEMSALGGKNVAMLAFAQWYDSPHTVDNMFVIQEKHLKIEL